MKIEDKKNKSVYLLLKANERKWVTGMKFRKGWSSVMELLIVWRYVFTFLLTFQKGLSWMLPDESNISVLYSKKPVFVILGFVGHTSSLSGTPSPSKSSTHASPLVSPKEIPKVLDLVKLSCWYLISSIVNLSVEHNCDGRFESLIILEARALPNRERQYGLHLLMVCFWSTLKTSLQLSLKSATPSPSSSLSHGSPTNKRKGNRLLICTVSYRAAITLNGSYLIRAEWQNETGYITPSHRLIHLL